MKKFLLIVLGLWAWYSQAQTTEVTITGSAIKRLTSSMVAGQEYVLHVALPAGYDTGKHNYPVVYLMDSQWDFPLLKSIYGEQYYDGFIPEIIIVGITWGGTNPNPDSLRARDYTPTREARLPQSGGADLFLNAIQKEVFPFVQSNYRTDTTDRTLIGCSLGGLFTLYTLFTRPGMFQRYVAASPAFMWGDEVLYQYAKKYFQNKANPAARVFMCVGGVERSVPGFQKLTAFLAAQKKDNLQVQSRILENTGHSGTKAEGYARGLQYVFARPLIHPATAVLGRYVSSYKLPDGTTVEIKLENNQLVLYVSPGNKFVLQAAGNDSFYATAEFLNIDFISLQGTVTGFEMKRYGSTQMAEKIK